MLSTIEPCDHVNRLEDCMKFNTQLKMVLDYSPNLFLLLDDEANFVYGNSNLINLLGLADDHDLVGKPIRSLYEHLHDQSFVLRNRLRYHRLKSGDEFGFVEDEEINWPTVGKRSYRITFRRMPFQDNGFDRILIILNDVTEVRHQEAERRIKDLLQSSQLPTVVWDEEGNVVACNEETFRVFGIPRNLSPCEYSEVMPSVRLEYQPDGRKTDEIWRETLDEALDKGFARVTLHATKTDGTTIPLAIACARITWHSGVRLVAYYVDLTEVKAKEVEIQEAKQHMRLMLDATPLCCHLIDRNFKVIDCSQETLNMFAAPDKQAYMDNFLSYTPEFQPNGERSTTLAKKNIQEAFEKDGRTILEWMHCDIHGNLIPTEVTLTRVKHKDGYIMTGYTRDLREMKKMMKETDEANERIKLMLDSTPLICTLGDEQNPVIDCNQETLNVFGFASKEEFINNFDKLYPEYQPDGVRSVDKLHNISESARENGKVTFDWTFQLPGGELLPVEAIFVRIPWKDTFRFLSYARDMRESRANERKIQEGLEKNRKLEIQKETAQAASEAKSQFLASMSHEIRTPMNTIIGLLELMRTDNLDATQTQYVHDIKSMSRVLLEIINGILDFHKIEEGRFELVPVHFDLKLLYNNLVSQYRFLAESKHLKFTASLSPNLPPCLLGDDLRISQIVTNLISNAIKYTQKGFVSFNVDSIVEDGNEYIAFTVEDSGSGIEEENFAVLFNRFEQFDRRKNRGIPGTGLGLPIAKHLAEMMGGYIRFNSEYCKGSVFTFLLPLVHGDPGKIEHATVVDRVVAKLDTKVLVVDDNPGNITVAIGLLARHGIVPQTAANGLQALEMIQTNTYDLVLMDHMMPEMDGVQATKIIRGWKDEKYEKLPIIAISANAIASAKEMFVSSGMNDFISKPIIGTDLNRVLLRWLPKEKIASMTAEVGNNETAQVEAVLNCRLQELTGIGDLSILSGLSRVGGDKKLYLEVLRRFCNDAEGDVNALKKFASEGKWKDYSIRVHAMKAVFATIGNRFLSDWAFRLEEAAMQEDKSMCMKESGNYCDMVTKFQQKLLRTNLMSDDSPQVQKQKITHRVLKTMLDHLLLACQDFEPEAAEPLADQLMNVTLKASQKVSRTMDESLATIRELVYSYEFDQAASEINKLIRFL